MNEARAEGTPVKTKAVLLDPGSLSAVWMNEAAAESVPGLDLREVTIDRIVPMAEALGVPESLRRVAETGEPVHLSVGLVSTVKGSLANVVSIHRLPDGMLLVLMENAWQPTHKDTRGEDGRRTRRRGR